jgi:hypothetical protein
VSQTWTGRSLEFETIWTETTLDGVELWLEWNERVFAYRFGFRAGEYVSKSHLGYADSLSQAQGLALETVRTHLARGEAK